HRNISPSDRLAEVASPAGTETQRFQESCGAIWGSVTDPTGGGRPMASRRPVRNPCPLLWRARGGQQLTRLLGTREKQAACQRYRRGGISSCTCFPESA